MEITARLLNVGQAAEYVGVSAASLRKWSNDGLVAVYRTPGGQRRYPRDDLDRFMSSMREASPGDHAVPRLGRGSATALQRLADRPPRATDHRQAHDGRPHPIGDRSRMAAPGSLRVVAAVVLAGDANWDLPLLRDPPRLCRSSATCARSRSPPTGQGLRKLPRDRHGDRPARAPRRAS